MNKKLLYLGRIFISAVIAIIALTVIYYLWLPVAKWYWNQIPAKGIDLFNSASYLSYLSGHFSFPINGWKYTWFSGWPVGLDPYPMLSYYLMLPLLNYFNIIHSVQFFALGSFFVSVVFSYLLFASISKNRFLAVILALGVAFSVNSYKALVYAGGIPIFSTQAFFPLVLYFIVMFLKSNNRRYLLLAGLLSGLGFQMHPQNFANFIFPSVVLLLIFSHYYSKYFSIEKLKNVAIYTLAMLIIGIPQIFINLQILMWFFSLLTSLDAVSSGVSGSSVVIDPARTEWAKNQFYLSFSDTNNLFIPLLGMSLVFLFIGLVISKNRKKDFVNSMAITLATGWVILNIYLLSVGINIFQGGWEAWYKLFWAVPVALGLLISQFYGVFDVAVSSLFKKQYIRILTILTLEVGFGILLVVYFLYNRSFFDQKFKNRLEDVSAFSSTYPEALGARLSREELAKIKTQIKPNMLDDSQKNYRLYSSDQTLNLWWNTLFETPLARGYIDPPVGTTDKRWGIFWMDAAFGLGKDGGTSLGDDWKTPEPVVENNIKFLLDWNAIKYLEGNNAGHAGNANLAKILTSDIFIKTAEQITVQGSIQRDPHSPEKGKWNESLSQKLNFYEVKDNLVTPIHYATNAPAVLVIGGGDSYDVILRTIAMMGLTSKDVIVAKGPMYIDDTPLNSLKDFDAIILYKYDYKNSSDAWSRIAKYIEDGGKVFIDTGVEVKESSTVDSPDKYPKELPDIFPVKETKRGDLGSSWDSQGSGEVFNGIDIASFSTLIFDKKSWNVSYPPNKTDDLTDGAKVLLTLQGYPVLAEKEYGKGLLIWSGFNLPYHVLYNYNMEEGKLLENILKTLYGTIIPDDIQTDVKWLSPEKRIISTSSAKGVLFKEEAYPGWSASINSDKGSSGLRIYTAGPTEPGYMYVRIPEQLRGNTEVIFSYNGSFASWYPVIANIIAFIFVLEGLLFRGKLSGKVIRYIQLKIKRGIGGWWEKDEE
jgi:hypothetical protein